VHFLYIVLCENSLAVVFAFENGEYHIIVGTKASRLKMSFIKQN
tara:strand:- start:966 stop:1097 length:132 start_codon:yes stop_codon:yes gene_type:complete